MINDEELRFCTLQSVKIIPATKIYFHLMRNTGAGINNAKTAFETISTIVKKHFHTCANQFPHVCKSIFTRVKINFNTCEKQMEGE